MFPFNRHEQIGDQQHEHTELIRFLGRVCPWLIPLLLAAACSRAEASVVSTVTPVASPTEVASVTSSPTPKETSAPVATSTKEATPTKEPAAQLIVMSEASGGPGIIVTPEGSQALGEKEQEITQIFSEINANVQEKINELLKGKSGNFFLVSKESYKETSPGVAETNRTFTVLREDGSVECIVNQAYTITFSYDQETSFPVINSVDVGEQTVIKEVAAEMENSARLAIEERLGRKLRDDETVKIGVSYSQNGVIAGIVSESESTKFSFMVPDPESIENGQFTNRKYGERLIPTSVVDFDGERFSFPGMQNPEIVRDEHGYTEVFANFWYKSTDPHTDNPGAVPNNAQVNPERPDVPEIMVDVMNDAMARLVGYTDVEKFLKDVESGKTFKLETFGAKLNEVTGNWEVQYQGDVKQREWDPSLGIKLTYVSADVNKLYYPIRLSDGLVAFGVTEEGQLVIQTASGNVDSFWEVTETDGVEYDRITSSSIMFPLSVMAANGSLTRNITETTVKAVLAASGKWTPILHKNADGTIKPDTILNRKLK